MKYAENIQKTVFSILFAVLILPLTAQEPSNNTHDSPQTLAWVSAQSQRIETILSDAMLMSEPYAIYERLASSYELFDAVAMAGVYCTGVRAEAESGRVQCDIIHFRLGKDLNTNLERAVEARRAAARMQAAAKICATQEVPEAVVSVKVFTPHELLQHDSYMAEMDIQDGLASKDLHILSQKLEHAIRLLYDARTLAKTLENCSEAIQKAENALSNCRKALAAPNWTEVYEYSSAAILDAQWIQNSPECQ